MFCSKCGNNLPDTAQFCDKCGYQIQPYSSNIKQTDAPTPKIKSKIIPTLNIIGIVGVLGIVSVSLLSSSEKASSDWIGYDAELANGNYVKSATYIDKTNDCTYSVTFDKEGRITQIIPSSGKKPIPTSFQEKIEDKLPLIPNEEILLDLIIPGRAPDIKTLEKVEQALPLMPIMSDDSKTEYDYLDNETIAVTIDEDTEYYTFDNHGNMISHTNNLDTTDGEDYFKYTYSYTSNTATNSYLVESRQNWDNEINSFTDSYYIQYNPDGTIASADCMVYFLNISKYPSTCNFTYEHGKLNSYNGFRGYDGTITSSYNCENDEFGNPIHKKIWYHTDGSYFYKELIEQCDYIYDDNGNCIQLIQTTAKEKHIYDYNSAGDCMKDTYTIQKKNEEENGYITYTYNQNRTVDTEETYRYFGNSPYITKKILYFYDENGVLQEESTTEYTYESNKDYSVVNLIDEFTKIKYLTSIGYWDIEYYTYEEIEEYKHDLEFDVIH